MSYKHIDQWNRRENQEIDIHKYACLMCERGAKEIWWGKNNFFTNDAGAIGHP